MIAAILFLIACVFAVAAAAAHKRDEQPMDRAHPSDLPNLF